MGNGIVIDHGGPFVRRDGSSVSLTDLRDHGSTGNISMYDWIEWTDPAEWIIDQYVIGNPYRGPRKLIDDPDNPGKKKEVHQYNRAQALSHGLSMFSPKGLDAALRAVGGKVMVTAHRPSERKEFADPTSSFHGKLMQVHSTGGGSPEVYEHYEDSLATYGEFDLGADVDAIDYDRNQQLVWPTAA